MKRLLSVALALFAASTFAATLNPVSLINPVGSTVGQGIVSTGATTAPVWGSLAISTLTGILPVAKGGTNAASASGTALDNISGLSGTGFLTRTGAGAYAFQSTTNGITLGNLAQQSANTVVGNSVGATGNVVAIAMPNCSTSVSALTWTSGTGFTCNAGLITASTVSSTYATTAAMTTAIAAVTPTVVTSYTPVVTASAGTFTTTSASGRYYVIGKLVYFEAAVTITTVGTASGNVLVTLPFATNTSGGATTFAGAETVVTGKMVKGLVSANSTALVLSYYDNTSTIAAGAVIVISGTFVSN